MTREEILSMPAGQEMDALIAERIIPPEQSGWSPSRSIAAAWEVVERLRAAGWCFDMEACATDPDSVDRGAHSWPFVQFAKSAHHINEHYPRDTTERHAFGKTMQDWAGAICRAALLTTISDPVGHGSEVKSRDE